MVRFTQVSILLIIYTTLSGQDSQLYNLLNNPELRNAAIGISIVDIHSGKEILGHNSSINLIPASTLKVTTAALTLKQRGPNNRIKTPIYYSGNIVNGSLEGNLYIKAAGDPSWSSKHKYAELIPWTEQILSILRNNKIDCIDGSIIWIIPESNYGPSDTWAWQDLGNYYGTGHYPIHHRDNSYDIYWDLDYATESPAIIIKTDPSGYKSRITNRVTIGNKNSGDQSYIYGGPYAEKLIIKGSIGRQKSKRITRGALKDPAHSAYLELYDSLQNNNISVSYGYHKNALPQDVKLLGAIKSPSFYELVQQMLFHSDNTLAENLLNHSVSTKHWKKIVKKHKESFNISDDIIIRDGSGLSHFNAISPRSLNQVLISPLRENNFFWDELLTRSGEGSLRSLFKSMPNGYTVIAKSGSMSGVRCYSGLIYSQTKPVYAFSFMANHFTCSGYKVSQLFDDWMRSFLARND